jgi:alpha-glutamyl/putrescinyl thymine pyrophosphorylase clade 1
VPPRPRQEVYDAYWYLAAERQRILFARLAGDPGPWTSDPILASYKFCNAYRASDRVSQWLIRDVVYAEADLNAEDHLLRIVLARLFSKPGTWRLLEEEHGQITWADFDEVGYGDTLDRAFAQGRTLYTAAFILCATPAFGYRRKHRNHLALAAHMIGEGGLPRTVATAPSLRELVQALLRFPLIGSFMAYQIAIDINYSELCDFSESEYSVAGPGARRGIAKCFSDTGGFGDQQIIAWMTDRQEEEFARLDVEFPSLYGRRLQAIDIQNLLCETDKYARVAFPALKSNRSRIKARFSPSGPIAPPFYPPKWRLTVPQADSTGGSGELGAAQLALL